MKHYLVVTPYEHPDDWVQPKTQVYPSGIWSGKAKFGEPGLGEGEKYLLRIFATESEVPEGRMKNVPKDAIFSEPVIVTKSSDK